MVPCCEGAGEEVEKLDGPSCGGLDLGDLEQVFHQQGAASLTRDSLIYELGLHAGASYDDAARLIEHAKATRQLHWDRERDVCTWLVDGDGRS